LWKLVFAKVGPVSKGSLKAVKAGKKQIFFLFSKEYLVAFCLDFKAIMTEDIFICQT